jgi:uncharacterized membrane protein YfcA
LKLIEAVSLVVAALFASLFGQGGGVFYTPVQVWYGTGFKTAAATSLFLIMITSFSATITFRKANQVDWGMALVMEVPTTLGAFTGGILSEYVSPRMLGLLLSILLGVAVWFLLQPPKATARPHIVATPSRWVWQHTLNGETHQLDLRLVLPLMIVVGILTSMVCIGGGILKVPLMVLLFGIPISIGSSAFMVGLTASRRSDGSYHCRPLRLGNCAAARNSSLPRRADRQPIVCAPGYRALGKMVWLIHFIGCYYQYILYRSISIGDSR